MNTLPDEVKERINYVISNGRYCGHAVNMPIIVEADSLEQLQERIKIIAQHWVDHLQKKISNDSFEFIEEEYAKAPVPGKEEVYRELLIEIDKALYIGDDLTDEDILKWYIDVITTIKDEIKETLASTKQSNESVQQVAKEENNGFVYDYEFLFKLTRKTNKLEWGEGLSMEEIEAVLLSLEYPLAGASFNSDAVEKTNDEFCICMFRTTSIKGERCGYCLKIVNG